MGRRVSEAHEYRWILLPLVVFPLEMLFNLEEKRG